MLLVPIHHHPSHANVHVCVCVYANDGPPTERKNNLFTFYTHSGTYVQIIYLIGINRYVCVIYMYIYLYIDAHIHTYIHTYIYIHTHIHAFVTFHILME